jgi:pilus assembly protein Flp/PilA
LSGKLSASKLNPQGTGRPDQEVHHVKRSLSKFWQDESGATAIEYGLIAAGIALAIIVIITGIGSNLADKLSLLNVSLK